MKPLRYIIPFCGVVVFVVHFLFLFLHAAPGAGEDEGKLRSYADWYAEPVFFPRWQLFAPDPGKKEPIIQVRAYEEGKGWTPFVELEKEYRSSHRKWRLSPSGQVYKLHRHIAWYLWEAETSLQDYLDEKGLTGVSRKEDHDRLIQESAGYKRAAYLAKKTLPHHSELNGEKDSIQFRLRIIDFPAPKRGKGGRFIEFPAKPVTYDRFYTFFKNSYYHGEHREHRAPSSVVEKMSFSLYGFHKTWVSR